MESVLSDESDFRKSKSVLGFLLLNQELQFRFLQHKYKEVHLHLKEDID
jgi:hypothetical protein